MDTFCIEYSMIFSSFSYWLQIFSSSFLLLQPILPIFSHSAQSYDVHRFCTKYIFQESWSAANERIIFQPVLKEQMRSFFCVHFSLLLSKLTVCEINQWPISNRFFFSNVKTIVSINGLTKLNSANSQQVSRRYKFYWEYSTVWPLYSVAFLFNRLWSEKVYIFFMSNYQMFVFYSKFKPNIYWTNSIEIHYLY